MRILGVIPARGGSKGIPRKNVRPLGGVPLIGYTVAAAQRSSRLARTVVSTDDDEIAATARRLGADVPFTRPAELASDGAASLDAVRHALAAVEDAGDDPYDAVCLLQPTTPFRVDGEVDAAIARFVDAGTDSLVTVMPVPHEYNPHWVFEPNPDGRTLRIATGEASLIHQRQLLPPAYVRDGSVYLTRADVLRERRSLYGETVGYLVVDRGGRHVNLDTLDDWARAEAIAHEDTDWPAAPPPTGAGLAHREPRG